MVRESGKGERRRARILDAATNVFASRGYRGSSMDDIASESETSKGGLYFHFPNKQTLFMALLDQMSSLLMGRVQRAIEDEPDPLRKIDIALRVVLESFASHRSLTRLFFVEAMGAGREFNEKMFEIHRGFSELISKHLAEAVEQGAIGAVDTRIAGIVWFGALHEVVTQWVLDERFTDQQLEAAHKVLVQMFRRSIGLIN